MKILMINDLITIALSKPEARAVREALVLSDLSDDPGSTCHEIVRQLSICLEGLTVAKTMQMFEDQS